MPSLFDLPQELRDYILELALTTDLPRVPPPASLYAVSRTGLPISKTPNMTRGTMAPKK